MELRVPCSVDPRITTNHPDSSRFNAPRMRTLKFGSCLSVPNERRLDKNVPRLRPDVADGATNSADSSPVSAPTLPRLTPESSACIFLPRALSEPRVSHEWAPTYPTALRTTPNEPRFLPTLPRRSHESCRISLIRGSAPTTLNFLKFSGRAPDQPRITKNHPDSPRTCYGSPRTTQTLLRLTPTHPDSRFVAHSAPDSGICKARFTLSRL